MSSASHERAYDVSENRNVDQAENQYGVEPEGESVPQESLRPVKRGRGRPKGSKNKPPSTAAPIAESSSSPTRKRGRPPKEKREDGEPTPKRRRGRPRKNPLPDEASPTKKRGRPKKVVA